jgi:hypothetical protein
MAKTDFTEAEEQRVDFLHNKAYDVMCELMGRELDWDMEWIGELCDDLCNHAVQFHGAKEEEFYPFIEE